MNGVEVQLGTKKITNEEGKDEYYIYYNGYEEKLPAGIVFKTPSLNCSTTYTRNELGVYDTSIFHKISEGRKNSVISINIGVEDTYSDKDYDINIMYLYENTDEQMKYKED